MRKEFIEIVKYTNEDGTIGYRPMPLDEQGEPISSQKADDRPIHLIPIWRDKKRARKLRKILLRNIPKEQIDLSDLVIWVEGLLMLLPTFAALMWIVVAAMLIERLW